MSLGFQTALSALNSAQRALQVIGHNLANAANPAYSRQRVQLAALMPTAAEHGLLIGRGVEINRIDRIADALLEDRIRIQQSDVDREMLVRDHLLEIETVFGEPGPQGLGALMGSFFSSLSALGVSPEDPSLRHGVVQAGRGIADAFRTVRRQLAQIEGSFEAAVTTEVERINALAGELVTLNDQIAVVRQGLEPPAAFLDRQEQVLRELSQHVDVQVTRDLIGRVTVVSGGSPIVSPQGQIVLTVEDTGLDGPGFAVKGARSSGDFVARSGRLKALQDLASAGVSDKAAAVDRLAGNLILEFNRVHATGVPSGGGWKDLTSTNPFRDLNNSGTVSDDRLSEAGLPFDLRQGALYVNVTDEATGIVRRTRVDINPDSMTVQNLVTALDAIPDLVAFVDPTGRLRISASGGHRFDFSNRVLPFENLGGTFGSDQATITGTAVEPYTLANGQSFTVAVDGAPAQTVTFTTAQFGNIFQATAAEVAAAINGQITGATASVVDGRVVLRSNSSGTTSTLKLTDGAGAPLGTLGLSTALETGSDVAVLVRMSGAYGGVENRNVVVHPLLSGTVGVTPGLQVEVRDLATNSVVAVLDVGAGYEPGSELAMIDGVKIAFGAGSLSPAAGDRFESTLIARSDTSDLLAATGTGGFFTGVDAATIGVSTAIAADPMLFAAALSGAAGDNANLLRLQSVREAPAEGLGNLGIDRYYQDFIAALGGESARSQATLETQSLVLESLDARRQAISGVNLDEELILMEQFQQTYQVAARFLQTMQDVTEVLLNLT